MLYTINSFYYAAILTCTMFFILISNGLLTKKHRSSMGTAVWEFMWCIDKMTRIDKKEYGWVLGGKPINLKDLASQLGTSEVTTSRNLNKLAKAGYIQIRHTYYGIRIKVARAKKRFNKNDKPVEKMSKWIIKIVKDSTEWININVKAPNENDKPYFKNDKPNKINQVDISYDMTEKIYSPKIFFKEARKITGGYLRLTQILARKDYYTSRKIHSLLSEKFIPYWREKTINGKAEKWQLEKTFDVIYRAKQWIQRDHEFRKDWTCYYDMWHRQGETCHCKLNTDRIESRAMKPINPLMKKEIYNIKKDIAKKLSITS